MSSYDRRHSGGGYNNPRKRRHREDDENEGGHHDNRDRRNGPRRRPYNNDNRNYHNGHNGDHHHSNHGPPVPVRIRRQMLELGESPLRSGPEEAISIAQLLCDNYDDERLRAQFLDLVMQHVVEQPLKTPFVAAVVLVANTLVATAPGSKVEKENGDGATGEDQGENGDTENGEKAAVEHTPVAGIVDELLVRMATAVGEKIKIGEWRHVKLYLKFLACLQSCLEGEGVFPVLEELFERAVVLQTASSDDTIGTELVKIIILTIPYIMATDPGKWETQASNLMDKTDIIASEPHPLQVLIDPFYPEEDDSEMQPSSSFIALLQKQLQDEAASGWKVSCLPRPWKMPLEQVEQQDKLDNCPKHSLPAITIPETLAAGPRPLFPEVYLSVYGGGEVNSVPPPTDITACLVRDALLDTINILDFNRNYTAKCLIDLDCYWAEGTFIKRATPFDRLKDVEAGKPTWKPEDVAVDAVFSQLFQLPNPEHKLVYYHSVLTEACRIAPAAIAPSLGRAIRFLYQNSSRMDLELSERFIDWFSHHLSNFGFTWKWTEWVDDATLGNLDPHKAVISGAIDKEIRLSFAQRIKNTLPQPYQALIGPGKEQDVPEFKFDRDDTPFASEGRALAGLLKRKAPDSEIQPIIERIHSLALDRSLDPLVASTDVFTTAVLFIGSKSLSHVLAAIERTKDRLLDAGAASELARSQIISAVMSYWSAHPGVALAIVEKLLNYAIVSPAAVVEWALTEYAGRNAGEALAMGWAFEMVFGTAIKVTSRVRAVFASASATGGDESDAETARQTREAEVKTMRALFAVIDDALVAWASGGKDEMLEMDDGTGEGRTRLVKRWGQRWLRVFKRRAAIEEAFLVEAEKGIVAGEMVE